MQRQFKKHMTKLLKKRIGPRKALLFALEIAREFIKKYLKPTDIVLDAGGGTGINAIMMAQHCQKVTLVDLSPRILELAYNNVQAAGLN